MSPMMAPSSTDNDTRFTAVRPPNVTVTFSALSAAGIPPPDHPSLELAQHAGGCDQDDDDGQSAVEAQVRLGEHVAEQLGGHGYQRRADERPEQRAAAADDGYEGNAHRQVDLEQRLRLQRREHDAVEAAAQCRQPAGDRERPELHRLRVDAGGLRRRLVLPDGPHLVPEAAARHERCDDEHQAEVAKCYPELHAAVEEVQPERLLEVEDEQADGPACQLALVDGYEPQDLGDGDACQHEVRAPEAEGELAPEQGESRRSRHGE